MEKIIGIIIFSILIFNTSNVIGVNNNSDLHQINIELKFEEPIIEKLNIKGKIIDKITINNLPNSNDLNKPCLPIKPLRILLPPGETVDNIQIITSKLEKIGDNYKIGKGGKTIPITTKDSLLSISKTSFDLQDIQHDTPENVFSIIGVHKYRGFSILNLNIYPVKYIKETGEISYYNSMQITVNTKENKENSAFRGLEKDYELIEKIIDNKDCIQKYRSNTKKVSESNQKHDYVIITNTKFKNSNGEYTFQDLIDHKKSKGLNPTIVTIEEILNNPDYHVSGTWGDANPSNPFYASEITGNPELFDDKQARIRNFIRYAYMEWETEYILLAGDADFLNQDENIVPCRGLFANESGLPLITPSKNIQITLDEEQDDIPSDIYYACLDGNFNYDCDSHFGESADRNDITDIEEADLYAEIWVGRACVDSEEEVSIFVNKTLKYEQIGNDPYISEIMFVGEDLGPRFYTRWGGDYKDLMQHYVPEQYNLTKYYDREDEYNDWNPGDLNETISNNPVHLINHDGHGNHDQILKMMSNSVREFKNEKHFFIYSHSCLTGSFDNYNCWSGYQEDDCIAEILTVEIPNGAFACILNARYGLGSENTIESPSGAYDDSFYKALFTENIKELGKANHYSKQDNIWRINENGMRWCYYQTNLFGDPELRIKDPNDGAPNKPSRPTGEINGIKGEEYTYTTVGIDPSGTSLYYWFDWGDNTNSGWIGPHPSGEETSAKHTWNEKGNFDIRVKTKNLRETQSEWSEPLTITMPKNKSFDINTFLQKIYENHPNIFPLLQIILKIQG